MIAAFEDARRSAGFAAAVVVDDKGVQDHACAMAKRGKLDTQGALSLPDVTAALVYTESDLSLLPSSVTKLAFEPEVTKIGVGACFGKSDAYVAGVYWVVIVSY